MYLRDAAERCQHRYRAPAPFPLPALNFKAGVEAIPGALELRLHLPTFHRFFSRRIFFNNGASNAVALVKFFFFLMKGRGRGWQIKKLRVNCFCCVKSIKCCATVLEQAFAIWQWNDGTTKLKSKFNRFLKHKVYIQFW